MAKRRRTAHHRRATQLDLVGWSSLPEPGRSLHQRLRNAATAEEETTLLHALRAAGFRPSQAWQGCFVVPVDASKRALRALQKAEHPLAAHEMAAIVRALQERITALEGTAAEPAVLTITFFDNEASREKRQRIERKIPKRAARQDDGSRLVRTPKGYVRVVIQAHTDTTCNTISEARFDGDAAHHYWSKLAAA